MTNAKELGSNRQATPPTTPPRESSQSPEQYPNLCTLTFVYRLPWSRLLFATLPVSLSHKVIATTSSGPPGRQLPPPACLHAMLTWESKNPNPQDWPKWPGRILCTSIVTTTGKKRSLQSTSAKQRALKKSHPNVRPYRRPMSRDRGLQRRRETRARMHCVHMGPQELSELLAGHESVRLSLLFATSALFSRRIAERHAQAVRPFFSVQAKKEHRMRQFEGLP
jgi:hypothetical protein